MAWNEPGDDKGDKDPWGNRDDQGPPDLDEAFRKLQENLSGMFRGKGSSGGGGTGGSGLRFSSNIIGIGGVLLLLLYFGMGVYTIDQQERGIVLRFGKVQEAIKMPGLHWNPPFVDQVLLENVTQVRSRAHDSEMLTEDENIVKVKLTVQYIISDIKKYKLGVRDPDTSLYHATESAVRHVVGTTEMHEVLTEGRALMASEVRDKVQRYMDDYGTGIQVSGINVEETAPPDAVRAAFDDVIKAREDEVRVRNEADAYANQILPEARGEAQRYLEEAEGYKQRVTAQAEGEAQRFNKLYTEYKAAPEVTRDRLYIDTMESVMSNSTKVLIDVEGGNNLLYLPLDKLMQQSQESTGSSSADRARSSSASTSLPSNSRRDRR